MDIKRIYEATSYKKWNDIGYKYEELGEEAEENNKNNEADAFYQFSSICGGDSYDDLDEELRDKYVIFACSREKWISYRQQTDW